MGKNFTIPKGVLKNLVEEVPEWLQEALYARESEMRTLALFRLLDKAYKKGLADGYKNGAMAEKLDNLPAVGGFH